MTSPRNAPKNPAPRPEPGPKDRETAMAMLAEGWHMHDVAGLLKIDRKTLRRWRDSPDGQQMLSRAKEARAVAFAEAVADAREILRNASAQAAHTLVEKLRDPKPFEALTAAEAILARVGIPRASKVEADLQVGVDLSKLSPEELDAYERIVRKATGSPT